MKRLLHILVVAAMLMLTLGVALPAQAAAPAAIEASIVKGLTWLDGQQQAGGRWSFNPLEWGYGELPYYDVATTGMAVLKFEDRAKDLGLDPFDAVNYQYAQNVIDGLNYIFTYAVSDANGIHFPDFGSTDVYTTGITMAAVAASNQPARVITTGPLTGQTYLQAVQGMMKLLAYAQDNSGGVRTGGWGYGAYPTYGWTDNSVSGYAAVGIGYASASAPDGFGLSIPASILSGLATWTTNIQQSGGAYDGGSWYSHEYTDWINTLKTGNLLQQFALIGVPVGNAKVTRAVSFINTYWAAAGGEANGAGWVGDYQAMFTMMKGLQAYGINTVGAHNWFDEVSTYIVNNQAADGHWGGSSGEIDYSTTFSTACALLTLEKAVPSALGLAPKTASNPQNTQHTVTATYLIGGQSQAGVTINFAVTAGPNVGVTGTAVTNGTGQAAFTYTGTGGVGTDTIRATAVDEAGAPLVSAQATKEWTEGGPGPGPEVGGNIYPANKHLILTPWLVLAIVLAVGTTILIRRRQHQS